MHHVFAWTYFPFLAHKLIVGILLKYRDLIPKFSLFVYLLRKYGRNIGESLLHDSFFSPANCDLNAYFNHFQICAPKVHVF